MSNRVLIIDDDKELLEELADTLSSAGHDVDTASDPYTAVSYARKNPPDVILLDLKMVDISGFEIASLLKHDAKTAQIPILAMSGFYTLKEHEFLATICGIRKFLKKPLRASDVMLEIENIFKERYMVCRKKKL